MEKNLMLKGITVLDFGVYGTGPLACSFLGSLGADVIRIERPGIDPIYNIMPKKNGASPIFIVIHANQRSIILDLKTATGKEIALRLIKKADVFIENHPPRVMKNLGLDYETVSGINPRLIYISSSGYGHQGPLANTPSADSFMQAMSGSASLSGSPGSKGELLRHYTHTDQSCAMGLCHSVLLALIARETTGKGQKIETSQFEVSLSIQSNHIAEYFATGKIPEPMGSGSPYIVPSQAFKTSDGKYIAVSVPREECWSELCRALDREDLEKDARFISNEDRVKNREQLVPILEEIFSGQPSVWWLILLRRHNVPCSPFNTFYDLVNDPHIVANKMLIKLDTAWGKIMHSTVPIRFSRAATDVKGAVMPDSDRNEILKEIDFKA
ncbi:MAG: CoA transferase [Dehalococcoidales bacterium]|nr:CoA transferase [Dehalococcoidales bacterium]